MAAEHVAGAVVILLLLSMACHRLQAAEGCIENERRALLAIRSDMYDPGGRFSSWTGDDCCSWRGVACDNTTDGHVTKLDLRYSFREDDDRTGTKKASKVNPSLLDLKHLKHLDLSTNDFAGSQIPEMMPTLVHLEYLNLSSAMFSGSVPPQLGNLSSLHCLDLSNCDCSGYDDDDDEACPQLRADDVGWLSRIPSLEYLDMSCVDLSRATSWLQQINSIPSLRALLLGNARLPHVSSPSPPFNLTSISVLDLSGYRNLSTAVLMWLSNASTLEYLHLQHCYFGLRMEALQVALASLPDLKALNLSNCGMNGDISGIARNVSRSLKHLDLSSNSLVGHIPPSLCRLGHLEYLNLSDNMLVGRIPQTLGNLTSLRHLNLAKNEITGEIPATVGNLVRLEFLRLSSNHIVGNIPPTIGNLTSLVFLRMGSNSISGRIPETLGDLIRLEMLTLCENNISGEIPQALGNLKNLQMVYLCENFLHGQIPAAIGGLYGLQYLDVRRNHLAGHIPSTFGGLCNLKYLDVSWNHIGGELTHLLDALSNCTQGARLQLLSTDSSNFTGTVPWSLGQLSSLQEVHLSSSSLVGNITEAHFSKLASLKYLDISCNSVTIILPNDWIPPFNAYNIKLDCCHLVAKFPSWIRTQTNLRSLRLSGVGLAGDFPAWFSDPSSIFCDSTLRVLDLSNNDLTGNIPKCRTSFPSSLLSLRLRNNSLSGPIPSFFRYCAALLTLDLGENKFSGEVPTWLGRGLSSLRALRLSSNGFHGTIPSSIGNLTSLQVLDLSSNNFSGGIPASLGNLRAMAVLQNYYQPILSDPGYWYYEEIFITAKGLSSKYRISQVTSIDFSDNILSGEIPDELTKLIGLHFLNLSRNHITGGIPKNIGLMQQLESLDLSTNDLSGEIPSSFSALAFLSFLNLSHNSLSGRIPTGRQLSTLNDPSIYFGNDGLCGVPLPACPGDEEEGEEENDTRLDKVVEFTAVSLGFVVGFWGCIGYMILKQRARIALFRVVDRTCDWIYGQLAIRFPKFKSICN